MGNFKKAIEVYKETFQYEEPEAITNYYIGECYEKMNDFVSSSKYYQKAIELDDQFADAWVGAGISFNELGNVKTAINFLGCCDSPYITM